MKLIPIPVRVALLGTLAGILHAQDPVLTTPGTATWTTEATTTGGTRTVFTLTEDTVLDWEHLNLKSGNEMVFNFTGGKSVVNFLGGSVPHLINGAVTSNGIVAFFSPSAGLQIHGSIIAKGVTLATLNADANEFSSGNGYKMSGPAGGEALSIYGQIEATDGDVVLGGEQVFIRDTAQIKASQDVLIGGGTEVSVAATGDRRIKETSGVGFVLHNGESGGSRIEVAAGIEIRNQGTLKTGRGRIFLEVGAGGKITNESSGLIVGDLAFNGEFKNYGVLFLDEADVAPPVNDAVLTLPKLSRPDGTQVNSESKTLNATTSMSASSDAGRDSNRGDGASVASLDRKTATYRLPVSTTSSTTGDASERAEKRMAQRGAAKLILQRSSFFGLRGGDVALAKR